MRQILAQSNCFSYVTFDADESRRVWNKFHAETKHGSTLLLPPFLKLKYSFLIQHVT